MTDDMNIEAETTTLQKLFNQPEVLSVPSYQRTYSWSTENWRELWEDIQSGVSSGLSHHLGEVMVVPNTDAEPEQIEIIDGQQRLTTLSVLFCAIRDTQKEYHAQTKKAQAVNNLLTTGDIDGNDVRQLQLLDEAGDDTQYNAVYSGAVGTASGNVIDCYNYYKKKAEQLTAAELDQTRKYIIKRLTFVRTTVYKLVHAYVMFETTNSRGEDLKPLEMAKAVLMRICHTRSDSDAEQARQEWLSVIRRAKEADSSKPTRPIKDVLAVTDRYETPRDLSSKKVVSHLGELLAESPQSVEDTVRWIDGHLEEYQAVRTASVSKFSERINQRVNAYIRQFTEKNSHAGIVLYWLYQNCDESSFIEALELASTLSLRLNLANKTAYKKRDAIHDVYTRLQNGDGIEAAFAQQIHESTPSNEALIPQLRDRDFKRNNVTKYVLWRVEADHFSGGRAYKMPDDDCEIEHIAPDQTFSADKYTSWERLFNHQEDKFNQQKRRVGNLTLLESRANQEAGTSPFKEKLHHYSSSDFEMSNELAGFESWSFDHIQKRSKQMAALIADSFSIRGNVEVPEVSKADGGESLDYWEDVEADD